MAIVSGSSRATTQVMSLTRTKTQDPSICPSGCQNVGLTTLSYNSASWKECHQYFWSNLRVWETIDGAKIHGFYVCTWLVPWSWWKYVYPAACSPVLDGFLSSEAYPGGNKNDTLFCTESGILTKMELSEGRDCPNELPNPPYHDKGKTIGLWKWLLQPCFTWCQYTVLF